MEFITVKSLLIFHQKDCEGFINGGDNAVISMFKKAKKIEGKKSTH